MIKGHQKLLMWNMFSIFNAWDAVHVWLLISKRFIILNLEPVVTLFDHLVNCLRKRTEAQRNHESYGPGKRRSLGFVVCRQLCCYDVLLRIIVPSTKGIVFQFFFEKICNCCKLYLYKL